MCVCEVLHMIAAGKQAKKNRKVSVSTAAAFTAAAAEADKANCANCASHEK